MTVGKLFTHIMCNEAVWYDDGQRAVMPYGWEDNCRTGGKSWLSHQGQIQDFMLGVYKLQVYPSLPSLPFFPIPIPSLPSLSFFLYPFLSVYFSLWIFVQSSLSPPVGGPGEPGRQTVSVSFWIESHRLMIALFQRFSDNQITNIPQNIYFCHQSAQV